MSATKTKDLRQFSGKEFTILKFYKPYRSGCLQNADGTFTFKSFVEFPKCDDPVLSTGTDRIKEVPALEKGARGEWRQKVWNKDSERFDFVKMKEADTKDFYKNYKKVFDVVVYFTELQDVVRYKKKDGTLLKELNQEVYLEGVGAGKVKNMVRTLLDVEIPMTMGKDRTTGEAKMVEAFDFEDDLKEQLIGKTCKVKVSGTGLDTKYMFLPSAMQVEVPQQVINAYK